MLAVFKKKTAVQSVPPVPPDIPSNVEDRRAEYLDAGQHMRAYATLRFAQLTLFIAVSAGILSALVTKDTLAPKTILKIGGLIVALIFFIFEERSTGFWGHYKDRAKELEEVMHCSQYKRDVKHWMPISATWAARLLFLAAALFWAVSLYRKVP